jgi:hypothetical protein
MLSLRSQTTPAERVADGLGRLKDGRSVGLGVARLRAYVNSSKLCICSIRAFLLADVLADLLQFEPDGRYGVTASPEMLACKVALLTARRAIAMALFPLRNPITDATGCFGGMAIHICTWSGIR